MKICFIEPDPDIEQIMYVCMCTTGIEKANRTHMSIEFVNHNLKLGIYWLLWQLLRNARTNSKSL